MAITPEVVPQIRPYL